MILNHEKKKGINLGDRRHPIKSLETWPNKESLRGIVGGKSLGIIGGVVLNLTMLKLGEASGPECLVRFKVTEAGGADGWVGFILGARAIDCPERGCGAA